MARRNTPAARKSTRRTNTSVRVERPEEKTTESNQGLFEKIQYDLQHNQNYLNLILGGLIVIVLAVLVYNYFNKPNSSVDTSQQTQAEPSQGDVSKDNLPGPYTVKEGDTLFLIAQKYYDDGYKYSEIVKANNIKDENNLEVGQVLTIPNLESASASPMASEEPSTSPAMEQASPSPAASAMSDNTQTNNPVASNEKGATLSDNSNTWGPKITSDTYTVQKGDWLSTIAGRAYGDIMQYQKIAQANGISNPDAIEVGTVLKLPR